MHEYDPFPKDFNALNDSPEPKIWGNAIDGYFSNEPDGSIISWGNNPFGEYSKPIVLGTPTEPNETEVAFRPRL